MKKLYNSPQVKVYGNVERITQGGEGGYSDLLFGNSNGVTDGDGDGVGCLQSSGTTIDYALCSSGVGVGNS